MVEIKNTGEVSVRWCGQNIPPGGTILVTEEQAERMTEANPALVVVEPEGKKRKK